MARRYLIATFALSMVLLISLPAVATAATTESGTTESGTTESGTEGATTETTAAAVVIEPAVPVDTTPVAPTNPDWTYRFFIPTLLVLAALVVIVTVIQYFTRVVRNRYRIVR